MVDLSLKGRHALVCGASSGIGRAVAESFYAHGAELTIVARRADALRELAEELGARGAAPVNVVPVDFDDGNLSELAQHLGAHPVQIVLNNTGGPKGGPILEAGPEEFAAAFQRHVLTAHRILQLALMGMKSAGYGRFINILSTSVREPIPNLGVSNTIRGAMASWAKTVASELPPGITINNVLPGFTQTDRLDTLREGRAKATGKTTDDVQAAWLATIPEGRLAQPEETAGAVTFLASEAGAYIRGVSLAVDGGRLRSI